MRKIIFLWGPVILFAAAVFVLSSMESPIKETPFPLFDKVAHFTEYTLFALLLFRALHGTCTGVRFGLLVLLTIVITVGYGASDEFHQYFVPHRTSDIHDLAADGLGAVAAIIVVYVKRRVVDRGVGGRKVVSSE